MALILVADDEKNVRLSLKYLLEDLGYAVIEAEDGEAALELAAQEHPDVILLDVWLPDLDGFHVCKSAKAKQDDEGFTSHSCDGDGGNRG